jgi:hypothetical protein
MSFSHQPVQRPAPSTVRVSLNSHGDWEVVVPDRGPVTCRDLSQARRVGSLFAARSSPCELIVQDAYHHVIHHEVFSAERELATRDR